MKTVPADDPIRFGDFEVDRSARELRRAGVVVRLQDLPLRLLLALVDRPGDVVTRADLREQLWGTETFVDYEAGLNTAIAKLRDALGDNAEQPVFIETLPKRGYRFIGRVETLTPLSGVTGAQGPPVPPRVTTEVPYRRIRAPMWIAAAVLLATVALSLYWAAVVTPSASIAVVLFDNETGNPEFDRLAQQMTDATVLKLTARPSLAVIGNAAVLRTKRPFRDIVVIRDALHVSYIVIGQLQQVDGAIRAQAHLIRTADQSHLWVGRIAITTSEQAAAEEDMAARIDRAVFERVLNKPSPWFKPS